MGHGHEILCIFYFLNNGRKILRRLNRTIYIHDEVNEQLERDRKDLAPRFAMLCRQLGVSEWVRFKPTKGDNAGWRRSPLGGNNGSHYYMWWLIAGAGPGKQLELEQQDIAIRAIRHHDLTDKKLHHGDLDDYWEFKFAEELDDEQVLEQPWTEDQQAYIEQKDDCQVLIGPPGSGKTSSLWRALELALLETRTLSTQDQQARALYITWSTRLAESAEQYFSIMAPGEVQVYDLTSLLAKALSSDLERLGIQSSRLRFQSLIENMKSKYALKKKALERIDHYYDLIRAWVFGRSVWQMKRVGDVKSNDEQDRLIQDELKDAVRLYEALNLSDEQIKYVFPELQAAKQVAELEQDLAFPSETLSSKYAFVVVDEVQDLTPLELKASLDIAQALSQAHPRLFLAGDEGQVVRPTFFQFAELNDQLFERGYHPQSTTLASNLRCPKVIADTVIRAKAFNKLLPTKYRPSDQAVRASSYETEALVALAHFKEQSECKRLIETLALNPNVYFIELFEDETRLEKDLGHLGELRKVFNTSETVKGLEFASVCIVGASALIRSLNPERAKQDPIAFRLDVNRLRVAMSRAVEHLIFIEPFSMVSEALRELIGGQALSDTWQQALSYNEMIQSDLSQGLCVKLSALNELLSAQDLSVDERVQGFIKRVERLFFDEYRANEAYEDLLLALELSEDSGELSDDLQKTLNELAARIALSEAFQVPKLRVLKQQQLNHPLLRASLRLVGDDSLLRLMDTMWLWSGKDHSSEDHSSEPAFPSITNSDFEILQTLYTLFCEPKLSSLSWLSKIINIYKWRLFEALLNVSSVEVLQLENIENILQFMGFDEEESLPLALKFRRMSFDALIGHQHQRAASIWQDVVSQATEDQLRTAQLFMAQAEFYRAAKLYESLNRLDEAFKAYRQAGAFDEAGRLIESHSLEQLEQSSITSLELITVLSRYLKRYPLSEEEKSHFYHFGDQEIALIREELESQKQQLTHRIEQVNEDHETLKLEQKKLSLASEELQQAQYRIEAKENELKRQHKSLGRGLKEITTQLSGAYPQLDEGAHVAQPINKPNEIAKTQLPTDQAQQVESTPIALADLVSLTETLDALPALGQQQIYQAELQAKEQELIQRAQELSHKELGIRRQRNRLELVKERLDQTQAKLEQEQQSLQRLQAQLQEQTLGLAVREEQVKEQENKQKQAQNELKEHQVFQQQQEHKLRATLSQITLEQERLESTISKSEKAEQKAYEAQQKNERYAEELSLREERLERKTKELEARLKDFENREARWEEEAHALSAFYPAVGALEQSNEQSSLASEEFEQASALSTHPSSPESLPPSALSDGDDWLPRYTSTAIKVVPAQMSSMPVPIPPVSELSNDESLTEQSAKQSNEYEPNEQQDTEVDLKPIVDEAHLPLPKWFEKQTDQSLTILQAGTVIVDQIESLAINLVYCPSGLFTMGSERGEPSESPCHEVQISRALLMGQSLVTQRLWALVMGFSPSRFIDPERPVERVTWHEAVQFCNRLSTLGGYKPCYQVQVNGHAILNLEANGYRLPSEAEWEYSAKAGESDLFAGSQRALDVAWSSRSARGESKVVMQKAPNAWGLYDMCGNVAEWCTDVASTYEHRPKRSLDPFFDAEQGDRIIRGGAWSCSAYLCRVSSRGSAPSTARGPDIGLRICRQAT